MKTIHRLISFALVLALPAMALAANHLVSSLSTSTVSTIAAAGPGDTWITISNAATANGGNQVNLGLDGGSLVKDQRTGVTGTDPATGATGRGYWLAAGQSVTLYGPFFTGIPIRAIMATGTTVLCVSTPSQGTSFPTN
jgi:hypothetical protein